MYFFLRAREEEAERRLAARFRCFFSSIRTFSVFLLLHSEVVLDEKLEVLRGLASGDGGFDLVVWEREGGREGGRVREDMERHRDKTVRHRWSIKYHSSPPLSKI